VAAPSFGLGAGQRSLWDERRSFGSLACAMREDLGKAPADDYEAVIGVEGVAQIAETVCCSPDLLLRGRHGLESSLQFSPLYRCKTSPPRRPARPAAHAGYVLATSF